LEDERRLERGAIRGEIHDRFYFVMELTTSSLHIITLSSDVTKRDYFRRDTARLSTSTSRRHLFERHYGTHPKTTHSSTESFAFYFTIPSRLYITIPSRVYIAEAFTIKGGKTEHNPSDQ
jgi:hypothetical protein